MWTRCLFTPTLFGPDCQTFQFDPTKITGVNSPPDHGPYQTAEPWSNKKTWPRSRSNWTTVHFFSSVKPEALEAHSERKRPNA